MIDSHTEETASLYVFDLLEPAEKAAFEARCRFDAELRSLVDELRETAASVSHSANSVSPPPALEALIWEKIEASEKIVAFPPSRSAWIPWTLAACLAMVFGLSLFFLQTTNKALTAQIDNLEEVKKELAAKTSDLEAVRRRLVAQAGDLEAMKRALAERGNLSDLRIATLGSKLTGAPQATGVIVWDEETKSGLVKFANLPPAPAGKDYQLWVIDPKNPQPVSAGLVTTVKDSKGETFHAIRPVGDARTFAVSIEPKGGVAEVSGPIALISD